MRDRLIKLLQEADKKCRGTTLCETCVGYGEGRECINHLSADYLLANGVIVPPCKVGDEVWVIWSLSKGLHKGVYPVKVYALRFDTKKNNMRICVKGRFERTAYGGSYTHYYNGTFAWNSVGKSVFLTKEEAEARMKGGAE